MADQSGKHDPIRERYFRPLERAERCGDFLFYIAAALSIAVVLLNKDSHPKIYEVSQALFLVTSVIGVILGLGIRLYWGPRAQHKRAEDFFSEGFDAPLTHERTKKYYNNEEAEPFRRLGFQLLENTLFSKAIVLRMCLHERTKVGVYAVLWLCAMVVRATPIDLVVVISQVLFSEQLVSRLARIEWLRMQFESLHQATYRLLQSKATGRLFEAEVSANIVAYENAKASAAITMSSEIFEAMNPSLSAEWDTIRQGLHT